MKDVAQRAYNAASNAAVSVRRRMVGRERSPSFASSRREMRLEAFTAKNFRSITDAYKLPLGELSVLVGPNNEGKSNILRGIVTAISLLSRSQRHVYRRSAVQYRYNPDEEFDYRWERDFPVSLQADQPSGRSEFTLEFSLDTKELSAFVKAISSNLASNLKLKLSLGKETAALDILLQGPAKRHLVPKLPLIAAFVADHIEVQYIPAIRPSDLATDVVESLLARELGVLETNASYRNLLKQLEDAQKPILDALAKELTQTISSFVPEVRRVRLETSELRRAVRRSCTVVVDDGTSTALGMKGDGVKSLTAISLLRHQSQRALGTKGLILAIEEPESHLHPRAVHRLREVLQEIAKVHQVIVTTHSPVLVHRSEPSRNIIVQRSRAYVARRLGDIREALGVDVSDNLASAFLVLLVEGEEDVAVLKAWLSEISPKIRSALSDGVLSIDHLAGATNLKYKITLYRNLLCNVFAFVDNDESARAAVTAALEAQVITMKDVRQAVCQGMQNSELEDFINQDAYSEAVQDAFGVTLAPKFMGTNKKEWSERVRDCFNEQGIPWNKAVERQVKGVVSSAAAGAGLSALNSHRRGPLDALAKALEERFPT